MKAEDYLLSIVHKTPIQDYVKSDEMEKIIRDKIAQRIVREIFQYKDKDGLSVNHQIQVYLIPRINFWKIVEQEARELNKQGE